MITSLQDFISLFPNGSVIQESGNEWKSPCPFCASGEVTVYNGIEFHGYDRFVWLLSEDRFFCRQCKGESRGRGGEGLYLPSDLAERFATDIAPTLGSTHTVRVEKPLRMLWSDGDVNRAHRKVDRSFWYRYGWDDDTINHFRLGLGTVYSDDGDVNTIPMRLQKPHENPIDGYVIATRAIGLGNKKHTPGSLTPYLWLVERYPGQKDIVIAEGEKDAISVSLLGWNVATHLVGASVWSEHKTLFLKALGYERILVFGDNNDAGRHFNRMVAESCQKFGIPVEVLDWAEAENAQPDDDVTEVLSRCGKEATRKFLESILIEPPHIIKSLRGTNVADYSQFDQNYDPELAEQGITPLEEVRGRGPKSIYSNVRAFLDQYDDNVKRGHGLLQVVAVGPGAGKTYTLIRVAEEEAKKHHEVKLVELAELRNAMAETEAALHEATDPGTRELFANEIVKYQRKIDEYSFTSISWFGQYKKGWNDLLAAGADLSMWYNFEERNTDNCQDYETVQILGQRRHDVGTYCNLGCPFREQCLQSGYLAQEQEARQYPIVFYRHQHLRMRSAVVHKNLIVVDENPSGLMDAEPLRFKAKDVMTSNPGWDTEPEDREDVQNILLLAQAVANTIQLHENVPETTEQGEVNPDYVLFGNRLLAKIDEQVQGITHGLTDLAALLDAVDGKMLDRLYQPTFIGGDKKSRILMRCLPHFYRALMAELPDYLNDDGEDRSSLLFLAGGQMEVYPNETIRVSYKTPVVLADATAFLPDLYSAMFGRKIASVYAPTIRNPNAEVVVVNGSDWTLSQIRTTIGPQLEERKKSLAKILTLTGEEIDLSQFPVADDLYNVRLVKDALTLIKGIAENHKSLMVVTHKTWREPLETTIRDVYPDLYHGHLPGMQRVAFGHFGSLRGTNEYEDYEAILLLGMFRIPYDVVYRRAQVWMRHIDPTLHEEINPNTVVKIKPYHGRAEGHGYRTFDHWLADALVCLVEEGEMLQCVERIRPHSTTERKYIYVCANRPFARFVSKFISKQDLLNHFANEKHAAIRQEVRHAYLSGLAPPSVRDLSKRHHISPRDISKLVEEFMSELGNITLEQSVIIQ